MVSYAEESEARRKLNKLDYRLVRNPERDPQAPNCVRDAVQGPAKFEGDIPGRHKLCRGVSFAHSRSPSPASV